MHPRRPIFGASVSDGVSYLRASDSTDRANSYPGSMAGPTPGSVAQGGLAHCKEDQRTLRAPPALSPGFRGRRDRKDQRLHLCPGESRPHRHRGELRIAPLFSRTSIGAHLGGHNGDDRQAHAWVSGRSRRPRDSAAHPFTHQARRKRVYRLFTCSVEASVLAAISTNVAL